MPRCPIKKFPFVESGFYYSEDGWIEFTIFDYGIYKIGIYED